MLTQAAPATRKRFMPWLPTLLQQPKIRATTKRTFLLFCTMNLLFAVFFTITITRFSSYMYLP
ncbi:hypothetical protein C7N43_18300 [Sphingobacteriales bacterium UPWRP_1]|nr:hypothetical protein B6N25_02345 [Sphingobacteriales bacterium TSM_CSS]PSJ75584.1 hypothetical protein C7N43_18300 [Sphingobacteriales bacterium UPWRP_1]